MAKKYSLTKGQIQKIEKITGDYLQKIDGLKFERDKRIRDIIDSYKLKAIKKSLK